MRSASRPRDCAGVRRARGRPASSGCVVLSGCSIYDAPLPGWRRHRRQPDHGHRDVPRRARPRAAVDGQGQRRHGRQGQRGQAQGLRRRGHGRAPGDVKLPDNADAEIRQTSLLGEKFVSLEPPPRTRAAAQLANGDVIGLDRTGRNPEVEEVFGALALLLNGGGVGQLKTIVSELNNAFDGREGEVRSVLTQIRTFMGQLDENKAVDRRRAREHQPPRRSSCASRTAPSRARSTTCPARCASVNSQRADLVKLLKALTRLSGVGVRVIQASKESTINSLRDLAPVLDGLRQGRARTSPSPSRCS